MKTKKTEIFNEKKSGLERVLRFSGGKIPNK